MKKSIIIICMLIAFTSIYSQNIKVKGHIVEGNNEALTELTGVSVVLYRTDSSYVSGAVSGQKGNFLLDKITPEIGRASCRERV